MKKRRRMIEEKTDALCIPFLAKYITQLSDVPLFGYMLFIRYACCLLFLSDNLRLLTTMSLTLVIGMAVRMFK